MGLSIAACQAFNHQMPSIMNRSSTRQILCSASRKVPGTQKFGPKAEHSLASRSVNSNHQEHQERWRKMQELQAPHKLSRDPSIVVARDVAKMAKPAMDLLRITVRACEVCVVGNDDGYRADGQLLKYFDRNPRERDECVPIRLERESVQEFLHLIRQLRPRYRHAETH